MPIFQHLYLDQRPVAKGMENESRVNTHFNVYIICVMFVIVGLIPFAENYAKAVIVDNAMLRMEMRFGQDVAIRRASITALDINCSPWKWVGSHNGSFSGSFCCVAAGNIKVNGDLVFIFSLPGKHVLEITELLEPPKTHVLEITELLEPP